MRVRTPPPMVWTFILVTLVTALIWVWAAGETRTRTVPPVNTLVHFAVPEPENWVVRPEQLSVAVVLEGTQLSLQRAELILQRSLSLGVPAVAGRQNVNLLDRLQRHEDIVKSDLSVISANPATVEIELDQIERFSVPVRPVLPGVQTEGEVVVEPREVVVAMPSQLRQRLSPAFAVEAVMERAELDRLPPGLPQTLEVRLRLPEGMTSNDVQIVPARVRINFTIRSRTREVRLTEPVRVQLMGPPEDREAYVVEIEPRQLNNVTITADADLARRIETREVPIVAVLHVRSLEMEERIESKRITYFIAIVPEATPGAGSRGVPVSGRVNESNEMPQIRLNIRRRDGT